MVTVAVLFDFSGVVVVVVGVVGEFLRIGVSVLFTSLGSDLTTIVGVVVVDVVACSVVGVVTCLSIGFKEAVVAVVVDVAVTTLTTDDDGVVDVSEGEWGAVVGD